MTPLLSLLFILLIAGVYGQSGYSVSYGSSHICALKYSTVTMSCTYKYPRGSHVIRAFWTKTQVKRVNEEFPDLSVDPEYSQRLQYLGDTQQNCAVSLSHVTEKDEHEYYFRFITDTDGKWIGVPGVRLSVTDLQLESPERVTEGDLVRLTCRSSCELTDTPTFIWYKNSQPITTGSIQNKLSVGPVRRGHADNYSCGVRGNYYISPAVYLNVRYAPDPPVISTRGSAVIMSGDSVTLSCSSDSNPPAEISWYKGETSVGSGRIFSISKISSDDSGKYKCKARNDHGVKYSDPVTLDVQYKPRSISVSINRSAVIESGDSVTLSCISDSNPPAVTFSWFKENQSSAVGSGQSFSAVQSGRFYCEAHNPHGAQRSDAVTVTVHHRIGWHVWLMITVALIGIFLIILIIVFIIRRQRKAPKAEEVNAKQDDLYASITESGVRVSESADCADAMYASVSCSQTGRDENPEEIQYATVQIHKKKPKRAEENECQYDNVGIQQVDAALRQSNVETVEEGSVIYSRVR